MFKQKYDFHNHSILVFFNKDNVKYTNTNMMELNKMFIFQLIHQGEEFHKCAVCMEDFMSIPNCNRCFFIGGRYCIITAHIQNINPIT